MKNNWKNTLKAILLYFILILAFTFIINLFYYFDIIGNNMIKYLQMTSLLIIYFLVGIFMGINSPEKGYLYGIRLSIILIIINIIMGLVWKNISFIKIIYYLIILFVTTSSAVIGINKKKM